MTRQLFKTYRVPGVNTPALLSFILLAASAGCAKPSATQSSDRQSSANKLAAMEPSASKPGTAKPSSTQSDGISEERRQDLLMGYGLLADTLNDESKLDTLETVKKLTLDAPNDAVAKLMEKLANTSEKRSSELAALRAKAPRVTAKPEEESALGDAINDIAKDIGESEMLSRKGGFEVRFVLLQAQATRMVSAMAKAIARFEKNQERKAWLGALATEYEGLRGDLISYLNDRPGKKK